jgi:serine/threonine protein kinase/Tol biopolymer transport system component
MALNPGDPLLNGHYRIVRLLGRGGFGFVYLAQDTLLGEHVAIKELIPALVGDEAMLKRFLAEARATMRLRHERIVGTHNVFSEGGNYYIVMEYMAGDSLEARLREHGSLSVPEAVQVTIDLCAGLEYAHPHGVVHCDLKPSNILFDEWGLAKVADFGIAHISGEMLTRSWVTPAGFVAGTLPYMSPEQADGVRDDPRIDVYALGAILYRMLTGRTYLEFDQRETPGATADNVNRLRREIPVPPSAHNKAIPATLDRVVLRALAKQPEERYASAEAMRVALQQQPAPEPAVSPLPPTKPTSSQRRTSATPTPAPQTPSSPLSAAPAVKRSSPLPAWFWPAVVAAVVLLAFLILAIAALSRGRDGGDVAGAGTASDVAPAETERATRTAMLAWTSTTDATRTATRTPAPTARAIETNTSTSTRTSTSPPTSTFSATPTDTDVPTTPTATFTRTPAASPLLPLPPSLGRIAYVSWLGNSNEIVLMNGDGTQQQQLTSNGVDDWDPALSPNGQVVVFMSTRDGDEELYRTNSRGGEVTRLTSTPGRDRWPSFSPDGQSVAFTSTQDGHAQIYVMNLDGSGQRNLSRNSAAERDAAFSPNGEQLVFVSDRDGNDELYLMNSSGNAVTRLTRSPGVDWEPSFSPDGSKILYVYDAGGNQEIYVLDLSRGETVNLTKNPAQDRDPAFAPDGSRIVFASDREGVWRLFVMHPDGSGLRKLTNGQADWAPSWSR